MGVAHDTNMMDCDQDCGGDDEGWEVVVRSLIALSKENEHPSLK